MKYLFIYGAFRDVSNTLLGGAIFCDKAFVFGKIYQVNEFYPGYVRDHNSKVYGDIYLVDDSTFSALDEYEGHEYNLNKIYATRIDSFVEIEEVFIYEYKYDIKGFKEITSGDWMLR